jgi:hypothetical protein
MLQVWLFLRLMAQITGKNPKMAFHKNVNSHIYGNQLELVDVQLDREMLAEADHRHQPRHQDAGRSRTRNARRLHDQLHRVPSGHQVPIRRMNQYRIRVETTQFTAKTTYVRYMPQIKRSWWPFWCDLCYSTHHTEDGARRVITDHRGETTPVTVTYIGPPV